MTPQSAPTGGVPLPFIIGLPLLMFCAFYLFERYLSGYLPLVPSSALSRAANMMVRATLYEAVLGSVRVLEQHTAAAATLQLANGLLWAVACGGIALGLYARLHQLGALQLAATLPTLARTVPHALYSRVVWARLLGPRHR